MQDLVITCTLYKTTSGLLLLSSGLPNEVSSACWVSGHSSETRGVSRGEWAPAAAEQSRGMSVFLVAMGWDGVVGWGRAYCMWACGTPSSSREDGHNFRHLISGFHYLASDLSLGRGEEDRKGGAQMK